MSRLGFGVVGAVRAIFPIVTGRHDGFPDDSSSVVSLLMVLEFWCRFVMLSL